MQSNGLLKWLMIPMAALLVFVGIQVFSGDKAHRAASGEVSAQLTPEEMKALGIDGDTPRDTVATLVAQVKQLRNELQTSLGDNKNQRAENERLRQRESAIDQRIQAALDSERSRLQQERDQVAGDKQQTQGLLQDLQHKLDQMGGKNGNADLPVGLGLEEGDGKGFGAAAGTHGVRWIEPDDARPEGAKGATAPTGKADRFPMRFGVADSAGGPSVPSSAAALADGGASTKASAKAVYTVPTNATLMGSVAMTALIGRVPIDGTVNDPYPFKVLVGPDNLTANGIDLPEVAGAVVSGTASGDWTLSCVRGQIRSVTFVFRDGTIRTVPEDKGQGGGNPTNAGTGNAADGHGPILGGLGWISDPHGIPCVSGERRSNAQQYLGSQALITAAGAGAASLIKSDSGNVAVVSNGNGALGTVGISGNEAMGRILAGGVQEMSQWVNKLYGQAFAAVYVPPGAQVAIHLEQPLQIDYDAQGRKVNHTLGGAHAMDLD
ncbi:TIGR03752 family integrating conjugative element protein [Paracidovorax valerianellae]|uniref:Integrating conjugative element protein, PFL_4705 family n=1 Tax=Paracidovorax valerianellae TaxID=187868 RepID=A0A1G6LHM5_9BURK|nr:TIGR03752 family integrating conjugative element protein [Paracidovorax valerianellae]MDA8446469.1 TIGR03752 family integrating conjugative element protein [Paracidovorax valerianellae]SDC42694.1 integrating conjugative element protein, PFL_4705 family [Paracidovorax valerianellae]